VKRKELEGKMNKNDLIKSIAQSANISKAAAERGLNGMLQTMSNAMEGGERVTLVGFGSFSIVERAPRLGRNPRTGEDVRIPSRRGVKFRPGKELVRRIQ
jgi:DNA-binding protein HU-beta